MMTHNYGNGYGQAARSNANLPTHIKCKVCSRIKSSDSYSSKQLDTLLKKMRDTKGFDASKMPLITCTMETSKQVVELECFNCDRWMGLDKFTKAQRKSPDHAECWNCVQERCDMEPHKVGRDDDEEEHHDSDGSGSHGSGAEETKDYLVDDTTNSMSITSVNNGPSTYPSHNGSSSTNGGGGVNLTGSTAPTSRQTGTSVAGTASTARTARSMFNPSRYHGSTKSTGGAWAKVPAGPRKPTAKADSSDDDDEQIIDDSD